MGRALSSVHIRKLRTEDLDFAYEMVATEQWNDRRRDIERMLEYESGGCFIAEVNGDSAGHVFSVCYGRLGWIGLLIVKTEYREKSIGSMLMEKVKENLLNQGVETIKLEAAPEIANLYRKLDFVDEYDSLRFAGTVRKQICPKSENVSLMKFADVAETAKFDERYFGANRERVISNLFNEYPAYCFVSSLASTAKGYVMCRNAEFGFKLGPWVCNPKEPEVAEELLLSCLASLKPDANVYVGVPAVNKVAVGLLRDLGFVQYSKSIRMRFGKELDDCVDGVFAIGGPMKG